jgi:hypothetical protein
MSEVKPYTEEELRGKVAYGCPDCARLLATIEAYKAEVEGARNAGLEEAANYAERREAMWEENYRTYGHAEQHHKFSAARSIIDGIRALKTTPTGGE